MLPPATDYEYDVFFSYKRHKLTLDWTREVHNRLKYFIMQTGLVDHEVKTFIDEEGIETGDRWPNRLKDALQSSRCMVCLWSPAYFQSNWCVSEWQSFRKRERRLKMKSHGLIAPLTIHDGDYFPREAKDVQWTDAALYTSTMPAFWISLRALDFEDLLKRFAAQVAGMVNHAPQFEADWPIAEVEDLTDAKIGLAEL